MSSSTTGGKANALIACLAGYLVCIVGAGLLWERPLVLTLVYVFTSGLMLWRWHAKIDVYVFFFAAFFGPLGEFFAIRMGAWKYAQAPFDIPIWLPLAWGIAALSLWKACYVLARDP